MFFQGSRLSALLIQINSEESVTASMTPQQGDYSFRTHFWGYCPPTLYALPNV